MSARPLAEATSRALALIWGFSFLQLFRYALDSLYPFWADSVSLTFFGYAIAFLVWLSFWRFFPHHFDSNTGGGWFSSIAALVNTTVFLLCLWLMGNAGFLFSFPLIFSVMLALQMFLFTSVLPRFMQHRELILTGMLPVALLSPPWLLFPLSLLPVVFPARWLPEITIPAIRHKTRLQPLRLGLDFLRFLFLAMSLYGIFDVLRERFYPVASILFLGAISQQLVLRYLKRKEHIKFGLIILGPLLAILGILFVFIPFSFSAAMGYTILSVWEAVYFKRAPEGYLKREQLLAGLVLLLSLALTFISYSWATILCGALVTAVLIRILFYLLRKYRQALSLVFLMAIFSWGMSVYILHHSQVTRDFWAPDKTAVNEQEEVPDPVILFSPLPGKSLSTNLYNSVVLDNLPFLNGKTLQSIDIPPLFLTAYLSWQSFFYSEKVILLTTERLGPYASEPGLSHLKKFVANLNNPAIKLITPLPASDTDRKSLADFELSAEQKNFYRKIVTFLAEQYSAQQKHRQALTLYQFALTRLGNDPLLFRQMAGVCGNAGDLECQITNLERYISLAKDPVLDEKLLLLELYYLQGNFEAARQMAESLLREDRSRSMIYLVWIFKTMKNETDQYKWQQFYYRVKNFPVGDNEKEKREKGLLIENIEEAIRANPRFHEVFQQEQKRQEFIQFPE